jgi:hypothetical protein
MFPYTLGGVGIGNCFLNRTSIIQKIRKLKNGIISNYNLLHIKGNTPNQRKTHRMRENIGQLLNRQRINV